MHYLYRSLIPSLTHSSDFSCLVFGLRGFLGHCVLLFCIYLIPRSLFFHCLIFTCLRVLCHLGCHYFFFYLDCFLLFFWFCLWHFMFPLFVSFLVIRAFHLEIWCSRWCVSVLLLFWVVVVLFMDSSICL